MGENSIHYEVEDVNATHRAKRTWKEVAEADMKHLKIEIYFDLHLVKATRFTNSPVPAGMEWYTRV